MYLNRDLNSRIITKKLRINDFKDKEKVYEINLVVEFNLSLYFNSKIILLCIIEEGYKYLLENKV